MKKVFLSSIILWVVFSCQKNTASSDSCNNSTRSISGHWYLTAFKYYSFPLGTDTSWQSVDTTNQNKIIIEFSDDSLFSYNGNYPLQMNNYNRYATIDSVNFRIYSSNPPMGGNFPQYPSIQVRMIDPNEIELTYMGIDAGKIEKYTFSCTN